MPDAKSTVRDTARYLRSVRPLDPEEIAEYVEGGARPGVVREYLRELAPDLSLVERADGTFVPAPDGPLEADFSGVDALPERWSRELEKALVERHGTDWHRGESGANLAGHVRKLKRDYFRGEDVTYTIDAAEAYALYHLANYYAVGGYVLDELGTDGLLPANLRVLDVGAGVGGPALALHDYYFGADRDDWERSGGWGWNAGGDDSASEEAPETPPLVDYTAVEPGAGADLLERFLGETDGNFHSSVERTPVEEYEPEGEFDLVCFGNVLSELDDPVEQASRALSWVADDGTLALVAPADLETSTELRRVERELADVRGEASVYAPTVRLWDGERPTDRGWSFDERPDIEAPAPQRKLAEASDYSAELLNTTVKFSYAHLRPDGKTRYDVSLDERTTAKLGRAEGFVGNRMTVVAAKLSRNLAEEGNALYKISDGSESEECYAVLVEETGLNASLATADYGDVLAFERALVLWNDDEEAYNVVVDEETIVDRV